MACCVAAYEIFKDGNAFVIDRRVVISEDLENPKICVIDTGGAHDPSRLNFDHHQIDGKQAGEHKMTSRRTATRLPDVTTSLLGALVKDGRVIEVVGRDNAQLHCTECAYTLPGLTQIASGETVNEIEMARREQRECPGVPGEL